MGFIQDPAGTAFLIQEASVQKGDQPGRDFPFRKGCTEWLKTMKILNRVPPESCILSAIRQTDAKSRRKNGRTGKGRCMNMRKMEGNPIEKVLISGRGSVGITEGVILNRTLGPENFAFAADSERVKRYRSQELLVNGEPVEFQYSDSADSFGKADLILIASKYGALEQVMDEIAPYIKEDTVILSLINGIVSEDDLRKRFPETQVIRAIAQKMDSVYSQTRMDHTQTGEIVFGADRPGQQEDVNRVKELFDRAELPYVLSEDIVRDQWSKLMLNCGINEVCAARDATYGQVMDTPALYEELMGAMDEVRKTANAMGIDLSAKDEEDWADAIRKLGYDSMPSMYQDVKAGRVTELPLFAGTIIPLAESLNIEVPVLRNLHSIIKKMDEENARHSS